MNNPATVPTASVLTLGCKVNQYESEAIAERLCALGFELRGVDDVCDVYIINTCAVTAEAERKSRQLIRRVYRKNANAHIIVCGCMTQSAPDNARLDGVDVIIGNKNKLAAADEALALIRDGRPSTPHVLVTDIAVERTVDEMAIATAPRTRAVVKICDGCGGKCAYCLIPSMRGPVRSRSIESVTSEVRGLADSGCREIVLTGIETASFGHDTGERLVDLLRTVAGIDGVERIRLGSLEPTVITDDFVRAAVELPKLVPHYHLSLQSGSSSTLARMRRKYTAESAMAKIESLRAALSDVMFTTDVIVGFPGETDADFEETVEFARKAKFLHMHVFQFSPRRGTAAETMEGQIAESVKRERSARLIAEGEVIRNSVVGEYVSRTETAPVLFESDIDGMHAGRTPNFVEVRTRRCGVVPGEIRNVRLVGHENGVAFGEVE